MIIQIYLEDNEKNIYINKMFSTSNAELTDIKRFLDDVKKEASMFYLNEEKEVKGLNDEEEG